jgi:peptidoglycan L-alanyl-D-glutamate endopeptidase CwlK
MASRKISDLHPDLQILCKQHLQQCEDAGIHLLITCTYRSNAEQESLYAQGRTRPGRRVTNAKPGESKHNAVDSEGNPCARAYDVVPLVGGKPIWGTEGEDLIMWNRVGAIGEALGLEWAGHWRGDLVEFPHFQLKELAALKEAA